MVRAADILPARRLLLILACGSAQMVGNKKVGLPALDRSALFFGTILSNGKKSGSFSRLMESDILAQSGIDCRGNRAPCGAFRHEKIEPLPHAQAGLG